MLVKLTHSHGHTIYVNPDHVAWMIQFGAREKESVKVRMTTEERPIFVKGHLDSVAKLLGVV